MCCNTRRHHSPLTKEAIKWNNDCLLIFMTREYWYPWWSFMSCQTFMVSSSHNNIIMFRVYQINHHANNKYSQIITGTTLSLCLVSKRNLEYEIKTKKISLKKNKLDDIEMNSLTWSNDNKDEETEQHWANRVVFSFLSSSFWHRSSFCDVFLKLLHLPTRKAPWCCLHKTTKFHILFSIFWIPKC